MGWKDKRKERKIFAGKVLKNKYRYNEYKIEKNTKEKIERRGKLQYKKYTQIIL